MSMKRFLLSTSSFLLIVKKVVCLLTVPVTTTGICATIQCNNGGTCVPAVWSPVGMECVCAGEFQGDTCGTPCICRMHLSWSHWIDQFTGGCSATCGHGYSRLVKFCITGGSIRIGCRKYRPCWESCPGIECESNPCENNGTCVQHPNGYSCSCATPYLGASCAQLSDCDSNPCINNEPCIQHTSGHSCDCVGSYLGPSYAHDDICYSKPCANGGTCESQTTSYNCNCTDGWHGSHCQQCYCGLSSDWSTWMGDVCPVTCGSAMTLESRFCYSYWIRGHCEEQRPYLCRSQPCLWSGMAITRDSLGVNMSIDNDETTTHIDGSNSEVYFWSSWSSPVCSVTCGDGIAQKARVCSARASCQGPAIITQICKRESCGDITDSPRTGSIAWSIFAMLFLVVIIIVSIGVLTMYLLLSRRAPTEEEGSIIKIMRGVFRLQIDYEDIYEYDELDEPSPDSTYMSGEDGMEDDENVSETKVKEEEHNQEVAAEATTVMTESSD